MSIKVCKKGHSFEKSSSCPVCPICEKNKKPKSGLLSLVSAPARRALESLGIDSIEQLANYSEKEISNLHGIGKSGIVILKKELKKHKRSFSS